ncbi:MAG: UvrD-helicase domain-containing protein [Chloroflexi bacterium]|nr:UvrD-helicase domain-containing protein [Chloroflexota bacterium]
MKPTDEQIAVIEAEATDLAVTAGAGSGKTHVLVERYLRLLRTSSIPEIAAVTFTEAAATEMRERVRRAVMDDAGLAHHRAELDDAVIGTVHSLALRLLREHPFDAAIDPSAAVLGEDEAELLRRTAAVEAIDAAAEAGDDRTTALREIGVYWVGQLLPRMLADRDDVDAAFDAMGDDPADWHDHASTVLGAAYGAEQGVIRREVAALATDIERNAPGVNERQREVANDVLASLRASPEGAGWEAFSGALAEASGRVNLQVGRRSPPDSDVREAFHKLRALGKDAAGLPAWNDADERVLPALVGIRALFADAATRYATAKREQHALDFLDLEVGAVVLLRDHRDVAADVRAGFRHLMVDEAQDINPTQADLIRLIAGPTPPGPRPHLFLVGDAKQSIYRFRGADVARFADLRRLVADRGGPTLPLSRSFRTHDRLVGAANGIFTEVFADASEPFEVSMERMSGRPDPAPGTGPHLVLMPVGKTKPEGASTGDEDRRGVEADAGAAEIAALLREGREVWDRREGTMRPAQPGDVAVLLRRFSKVHAFEQALEAHEVPYTTPSGMGFFTRQEVLDCAHLLRWLAEPHDEIALAGLLRSPFFVLRDDTLLALREHRRSFFDGLGDPPDTVEGRERERCAHAAGLLGELRGLAGTLPADALLERALETSGVEAAWRPIEGGEQAVANIRKLVRIVRTLAGYTLPDVVEYLDQRREELDVREGPAVLDRPEAVQIMTVHASKGLEFPIVWIPEAHLPSRPSYEPLRWHREDGVSATLQPGEEDSTRPRPGFYAHLLRRDQAEDAAEHRRLFYVAATRAADYLYVSGDDANRGRWLQLALAACEAGDAESVEVRDPLLVDVEGVARRAAPRDLRLADEADEQDYIAPLLERPRVIPVRASTPVTALREPTSAPALARRGDGHGALRGSVVHRAIEDSAGDVTSLDAAHLATLVREESERALDDATVDTLAREAAEMLAEFARTSVAEALSDPGVERWFELPFAWDWDGLPVHGAIDLVYRDAKGWHVVDFKTDSLEGATADAVARRYLVQIGLYQRAVEAAVGETSAAGLLFLRSGELVQPARADLDAALDEARERVDAGGLLDPETAEFAEEPE